MTRSTISPESSDAITSAIASVLSSRLRMQDQRLDDAHIARLADEAIVASTALETLTAQAAARAYDILANKTGQNLANAVRLSGEALDSDDGLRRWFGTAHKTALAAFHKANVDYQHGKADKLDLFLAQVTLTGVARARGILGIPVPAHELREPRNVRPFDASDYPNRDVRMAIMRATFEADETSIALLRRKAGTLPDDAVGQITLVVSAIDADDKVMHENLGALAGRIASEDHDQVTIGVTPRGRVWARMLSATLRPRDPSLSNPVPGSYGNRLNL